MLGAFGFRDPLRAKPLSSATPEPAPARGPSRLHVPGELPTLPRRQPSGPVLERPRRSLTRPRVREGGAGALSPLRGVPRARQLVAAAPLSCGGRRRHCGTTGGSAPSPAAARGATGPAERREGGRAAGALPAPARCRFAAAGGWRAELSRAERSAPREEFSQKGTDGKARELPIPGGVSQPARGRQLGGQRRKGGQRGRRPGRAVRGGMGDGGRKERRRTRPRGRRGAGGRRARRGGRHSPGGRGRGRREPGARALPAPWPGV